MTDPSLPEKARVRASFDRAAPRYDEVAVLQREVGERLLDRLDYCRIDPRTVLDLGCGTGVATAALARRYRRAAVVGLDLAPAMLRAARRRGGWRHTIHCVCGDIEGLPLAGGCCDLLFSNQTLQWSADLPAVFRECRRVLRPGGLLMFSTLGPDTLIELRRSWAAAGGGSHVMGFMDLHDVGDMLLAGGWQDPVMDMDRITLTYRDVGGLMRDLKTLGAHNVTRGRSRGLTGKARLEAMVQAYEGFRRDGLLPATYEVVYGHAWAPREARSETVERGVARFPVAGLRRRP